MQTRRLAGLFVLLFLVSCSRTKKGETIFPTGSPTTLASMTPTVEPPATMSHAKFTSVMHATNTLASYPYPGSHDPNTPAPSLFNEPYPIPVNTPVPPVLLTATATPPPTRTPLPRPTFTLSPTPLATIIIASADHLPEFTHDLQFQLGGYQILLLNHQTGKIDVLLDMEPLAAGGTYRYLTYRGDKVFRIGGEGYTEANPFGPFYWEVVYLDSGKSEILRNFDTGPGKEEIIWPNVSPDGKWFTYCRADMGEDFKLSNFMMYLISTGTPRDSYALGSCSDRSVGHWSPDSQQMLWNSDDGIWSVSPPSSARRIFTYHQNRAPILVPETPRWSPSGRYVMVYEPGAIEGGSLCVLDTQTGRVADIPGTWQYVTPAARPGWIGNDRLVTLNPGDWTGHKTYPAQVNIYRIDPGLENMLVLESSYPLDNIDPAFIPFAPMETKSGQLVFAALPVADESVWPSDLWDGGIYSVDPVTHILTKLNILPNDMRCYYSDDPFHWVPDGSGVLIDHFLYTEGYLYVPTEMGLLYDITALIGDPVWNIHWVP